MKKKAKIREGLGLVRFLLVFSSLSPVFLLWAIKGVEGISDKIWIPVCLIAFFFPSFLLWVLLKWNKRDGNYRTIKIHTAKDQREHLLTYLFAILIPLFGVNFGGYRDLISILVALSFILFLFWHMHLHYMNLFFAIFGYKIFTVKVVSDAADPSRLATYVVLSKNDHLTEGIIFTGWRIGGKILVEREKDDQQ